MKATWAFLCGLLLLVILLIRDSITSICQREMETRLSQLPEALLKLAVRRLPKEWRDDLGGEWISELKGIYDETKDLPLTCLIRRLSFAVGLLIRSRAVARELAGTPHTLTTLTRFLLKAIVAFRDMAWRTVTSPLQGTTIYLNRTLTLGAAPAIATVMVLIIAATIAIRIAVSSGGSSLASVWSAYGNTSLVNLTNGSIEIKPSTTGYKWYGAVRNLPAYQDLQVSFDSALSGPKNSGLIGYGFGFAVRAAASANVPEGTSVQYDPPWSALRVVSLPDGANSPGYGITPLNIVNGQQHHWLVMVTGNRASIFIDGHEYRMLRLRSYGNDLLIRVWNANLVIRNLQVSQLD